MVVTDLEEVPEMARGLERGRGGWGAGAEEGSGWCGLKTPVVASEVGSGRPAGGRALQPR